MKLLNFLKNIGKTINQKQKKALSKFLQKPLKDESDARFVTYSGDAYHFEKLKDTYKLNERLQEINCILETENEYLQKTNEEYRAQLEKFDVPDKEILYSSKVSKKGARK